MSFISSFVGWFLSNFTSEEVSMLNLVLTMICACVIAVYVFMVYRVIGRKTIYSMRYNVMISAMVLITTAIIYSIGSDVVLSLGVLGALTIIRFRTAIKEALDIVFLFWAITLGICIGMQVYEIAFVLSGLLTALIFFLEEISLGKEKILMVELDKKKNVGSFLEMIRKEKVSYKVKAQKEDKENWEIILCIKCKDEYRLVKTISDLEGINSVSLITQLGEKCF